MVILERVFRLATKISYSTCNMFFPMISFHKKCLAETLGSKSLSKNLSYLGPRGRIFRDDLRIFVEVND